jgi:ribose transport system permease protein
MKGKTGQRTTSLSTAEHKTSLLKTILIKYGVIIASILLFIIFSIIAPSFLTVGNVFNIINNGAIIGILALGLTAVIIAGEFDISFAANATLCAIISIALLIAGMDLLPAWLLTLLIGIGISCLNGFIIVVLGVPSFVTTLGMMAILLGVANWVTKGAVIYSANLPAAFKYMGRYMVGGLIPSPVIIFFVVALVMIYLLEYTYVGRYIYASGGNIQAARRVGINVKRYKYLAFVLIGILSGLAGLIISSKFGAGNPRIESSFQFPAIVSAYVGAVSLREGLPNPTGTVTAVLLISIVENGLLMLGSPLWVREVVLGLMMMVAVSIIATMKTGSIAAVKVNM